jgi:hypothetical protein
VIPARLLKISTKINTADFSNLVWRDRTRAQALKQLPHLRERTISSGPFSAANAAVFYTAEDGCNSGLHYSLLTITSSQYVNLQTLSFDSSEVYTSYDLIANAQIWPRSLNYVTGGTSNLVVNDIGFPDGLAFDFINGYTFLYDLVVDLQSYVVLDAVHLAAHVL